MNHKDADAKKMAEELVFGTSEWVSLQIQSGWLADGVKVEIKDLVCGYGDIPRNVIDGLTLTFPRKCKAGIVGATGCGKSTLLLCLLRTLEPRRGKILFEG